MRYNIVSILISIALIIIGFILVLKPAESLITIIMILGISALAFGLVKIIRFFINRKNTLYFNYSFDFIFGIIGLIIGLLLIFNPIIIASIIPILIGIILICQGAFKLQYSFQLMNVSNSKWGILLTIALITLIAGIIIIFNPFDGATAIAMLIGVLMIAEGIINIIEHITLINVNEQIGRFIKK